MRAVRCVGPGVEVVDVDEPVGDGELIDVTAVSICASDFIYINAGSREIIGHEIAGRLEDGTPVVVEGIFGCGQCDYCQQGRFNLCARCTLDVLGMTVPGGMSEHFRAPRRAIVTLPPGLRPEDASLVEPGSVAWHACRMGGVGPDTRVAIVGAGAIGLLAVAMARSLGATDIALEARHPHQRAMGEQFGATEPRGLYDVVLETAGSESAIRESVELVRPRGVVSYIGVYGTPIAWPYEEAFVKEATIVPALGYGPEGSEREFEKVATLLSEQPEITASLITHRFGIEDAAQAFETARDRSAGTFRVASAPHNTPPLRVRHGKVRTVRAPSPSLP